MVANPLEKIANLHLRDTCSSMYRQDLENMIFEAAFAFPQYELS